MSDEARKSILSYYSLKTRKTVQRYENYSRELSDLRNRVNLIQPFGSALLTIYEPSQWDDMEAKAAPLRKRMVQLERAQRRILEQACDEDWDFLLESIAN
jgi:hypothetical protein